MKFFYVTEDGKLNVAPADSKSHEDVWDYIGFHNIKGVVIVIDEVEATNWKAVLVKNVTKTFMLGMDKNNTYDRIVTPTGMHLEAVEQYACEGCFLDRYPGEAGMGCNQAPTCNSSRTDRKVVSWARVEK